MSIAAAGARSFIRSSASSFRNSASRFAHESKAKSSSASAFSFSKQKPLSQRIFRSPVELSCCLDSLMPFHSANSSALLISKLGVSRQFSWLLQDSSDDV